MHHSVVVSAHWSHKPVVLERNQVMQLHYSVVVSAHGSHKPGVSERNRVMQLFMWNYTVCTILK